MTEIGKKLKILRVALEGFRDLENARTKFTACELPSSEEIEKLQKRLFEELIERLMQTL